MSLHEHVRRCPTCGIEQRLCDRCGGWLDAAAHLVPPPYGSLNAAYPVELCRDCAGGLVLAIDTYLGTNIAPIYRENAKCGPVPPIRGGET